MLFAYRNSSHLPIDGGKLQEHRSVPGGILSNFTFCAPELIFNKSVETPIFSSFINLLFQYIECSALTQKNLKMAFDSALLSGLDHRNKYIPRPIAHTRISPGARLRKSMRRLSHLASRKKLTRHRDSADSDSSLTSSASSSSSMLSDSSLSDASNSSSTYSKTFDPDRIESQLSIKSQLRSMITCFG